METGGKAPINNLTTFKTLKTNSGNNLNLAGNSNEEGDSKSYCANLANKRIKTPKGSVFSLSATVASFEIHVCRSIWPKAVAPNGPTPRPGTSASFASTAAAHS